MNDNINLERVHNLLTVETCRTALSVASPSYVMDELPIGPQLGSTSVIAEDTSLPSVEQQLVTEIRRSNELTAEHLRVHRDWKLALRQGLLTGLGAAIGATVLLSVLLWMLQPLKRLEVLKPTLDRIAQQLERTTGK